MKQTNIPFDKIIKDLVDVKRAIFLIAVCFILLLSRASASSLSDYSNEQALNITLTLTGNTTQTDVYFDNSKTSNDLIDITYEGYTIEDVTISELLNGIDFRLDFEKGQTKPTLTYEISGAYTTTMISNALSVLSYSSLEELFNDKWTNEIPFTSNGYFEKSGNNYVLFFEEGLNTFNLSDIEKFSKSINFLDSTYGISYDLTGFDIQNGEYIKLAEIQIGNENISKEFNLIISGIVTSYAPQDNETLEIVSLISDLEIGTNIIISIENKSDYTSPSNVKTSFEVLNITADKATDGMISFKVNKTEVSNPSYVFMYVFEGSWTKLTTRYIGYDSNYYLFEADTPHFSIFMIAEENIPVTSSSGGSSSSSKKSGSVPHIQVVPDTDLEPETTEKEEEKDEVIPNTKVIKTKQQMQEELAIKVIIVLVSFGFAVIASLLIVRKIKRKEKNLTS